MSTLMAAGAALVTVRQASSEQRITRDGQVTDRYTAAVGNLGAKEEEVRIGGLYALQRLAKDSPRDAATIVQVISAYVRTHTPQPSHPPKPGELPIPANDVDTALRILTAPLTPHTPPDLHDAYLAGAELQGANLAGANLKGADLYWANLKGANLKGADLDMANLASAYMNTADLSHVNWSNGTNKTCTDFTGAKLPGDVLPGLNLPGKTPADTHGC